MKNSAGDFFLAVKIIPNSAQNKITGKFLDEKGQECLKINIAAQPEDGKANDELVKFLSQILKIPKSKIEILRGATARHKLLKFSAGNKADLK